MEKDDQFVAYRLLLRHQARLWGLGMAYDRAHKSYSPGTMLFPTILDFASQQGCSEYHIEAEARMGAEVVTAAWPVGSQMVNTDHQAAPVRSSTHPGLRQRSPLGSLPAALRSLFTGPGFYFWLTLALFGLAVAFVNPVRETAWDDDWSYSLTVRGLVETGDYELNEWTSASYPFQAYWGALFAMAGGYSFTTLRVSTLVLWLIGLIGFYYLARAHGLGKEDAGVLMLVLCCSPLAAHMAFTFMTNVPFLSCMIVALLLYTRALRLRDTRLMLLASFVGAAAILIRQFGVALMAGLFLLWFLDGDRTKNARFFSAGLFLPTLALGYQVQVAAFSPTWGMRLTEYLQTRFLIHDPGVALRWLIERPAPILVYLAFFALPPLLPLAIRLGLFLRTPGRAQSTRQVVLLVALCVAGMLIYLRLAGQPWLMPLFPWHYGTLNKYRVLQLVLTLLLTIGGVTLASALLLRSSLLGNWKQAPPGERLLALVTLFIGLQMLVFCQIGDDYLLPLLPYAILFTAKSCLDQLARLRPLVAVCCIAILLPVPVVTRVQLAKQFALWQAAESLSVSGTAPCRIASTWEWMSYHCSDEFFGQHPPATNVALYFEWLHKKAADADYLVSDKLPDPTDPATKNRWRVVGARSYAPVPFVRRPVYLLERAPF